MKLWEHAEHERIKEHQQTTLINQPNKNNNTYIQTHTQVPPLLLLLLLLLVLAFPALPPGKTSHLWFQYINRFKWREKPTVQHFLVYMYTDRYKGDAPELHGNMIIKAINLSKTGH